MKDEFTDATEEILECIFRLQERDDVARTSKLVKMLKVAPGTITNTIERLEKKNLVTHKSYRGVKLTEKGHNIALNTVRRHRLAERLLTDILGMKWNEVHEAACRLEHDLTDEIAEKIEAVLDHPDKCPHGNPIPTKQGEIAEEKSEPLASLEPGERGLIVQISDESPKVLESFEGLGLRPGVSIELVKKATEDSATLIKVEQRTCTINPAMAFLIKVRKLNRDIGTGLGVRRRKIEEKD